MGLWDGYDNLGDRIWMDNWSNPDTNTAQGRIGRLEGPFNMRAENNASAIAQRATAAGNDAVAATKEAAAKASSTVRAIDAATARLSKNAALKALKSKPVKFNPPLHESIRPQKSPYRASYSSADLSRKVFESPDARTAGNWRLGQLVGANEVTGAYKDKEDLDYRFGFRFLYNPTSLNSGASINSKTSPSALKSGSGLMLITGSGLGSISLEILLNRIPEVSAPRNAGKSLTDDEKELRDKGTMVDLDYLFRVANGTWEVTTGYGAPVVEVPVDKSDTNKGKKEKKPSKATTVLQSSYVTETGDIGMMIPTPMWLSIGPGLKYYGWLQEVTHKHTMFSPDMVPMLTRVSITFQRLNMGTEAEFKELDEAASQYAVMMGDVTAPPPDTTAVAPGTTEGSGEYPPVPEIEKKIKQGIAAKQFGEEIVKNTIAGARAAAAMFPKLAEIAPSTDRPDDGHDHPHGFALDLMIEYGVAASGAKKDLGDEVAKFYIDNAKRFGVKYIIWYDRIWKEYTGEWGSYSNGDGQNNLTGRHQDHVHVSFYQYTAGNVGGDSPKDVVKGTYWDEKNTLGLAANGLPPLVGSPKQIGEAMTAYARKNGWPGLSYSAATSADYSGHVAGSWHYGPYDEKWAGDFGDGAGSPAACRKLAEAISEAWGMGWTWDKGLVNKRVAGYDLQLIYGNYPNHDNHVHFGVRVADRKKVYGNTGT